MKSTFIKSTFILSLVFFISACSINLQEQTEIMPSKVTPIEVSETANIQAIRTPTILFSICFTKCDKGCLHYIRRECFYSGPRQKYEKRFAIRLGNNEAIGNFVWSHDETMVIFARLKTDEENEVVSSDYLRLNLASGELITLLKNDLKYLNIIKMTNSEVVVGQNKYSLMDGAVIK